MSCKKSEERLLDDEQAFLDRAVREHLKDCPACSRLYEELEEIEELHRALARSERAPLDFTGQVIEQISAGSRLKFPLLATGLILAVIVGMSGIGSSPERSSTESVASQIAPVGTPTVYSLLDQAQPVEFDLSYPRVQIYVIDPPATLKPENNSRIEILPVDQTQTDYLKYVSQ